MNNWDTLPATQRQLEYLRLFGYTPNGPVTKAQAHELISAYEEDPEKRRIRDENKSRECLIEAKRRRENLAYYLHMDCEAASKEAAKGELRRCRKLRLDFWKDSFDLGERLSEAFQAYALHEELGCRFRMPRTEQIQAVLDALDKHSQSWDMDHPKAFYSTLELNFPELLR